MPQHTIDPVVLAAMIIVRLQTIVSREVAPGDTAVVTVGSCHAGTRSNVIPDFAVLELNVRSYSSATRQRMLGAAATERVARAFAAHFADRATEIPKQTVSEDFSKIPDAVGAPYCYWGFGFTDRTPTWRPRRTGTWRICPPTTRRGSWPPLQPTCGSAPRR